MIQNNRLIEKIDNIDYTHLLGNPSEVVAAEVIAMVKDVVNDYMEAGLLIELPCAVGGTLYHIVSCLHQGEGTLYWEHKIEEQIPDSIYQCFMLKPFIGESAFFTKEEALAKLKELEGDKA